MQIRPWALSEQDKVNVPKQEKYNVYRHMDQYMQDTLWRYFRIIQITNSQDTIQTSPNKKSFGQGDGVEDKDSTRVSRGKVLTIGNKVSWSSWNEVGCCVRSFCNLLCSLQVSWVLDLIFPTWLISCGKANWGGQCIDGCTGKILEWSPHRYIIQVHDILVDTMQPAPLGLWKLGPSPEPSRKTWRVPAS